MPDAFRNPSDQNNARIFLVVVDASPELKVALRYASLRAQRSGGRVALLYVLEPTETQAWIAVEDLIRLERRQEAEDVLADLSEEVRKITGAPALTVLREGDRREELLKVIEQEPKISILVLGASPHKDGPGPLVTHLAGRLSGRLRVPITIVPGGLSDDQLEALT